MQQKRHNKEIIENFILREVKEHPSDIATFTASHFEVSRVTANRYLDKLVQQGLLETSGKTKACRYNLRELVQEKFSFPITKDTEEYQVWQQKIRPLLTAVKENILDICLYGVTELVNNVIDHSGSKDCQISIKRNAQRIEICLKDSGIGIFEKIRKEYNLDDPHQALLELSKGKLTTDPKDHTGEGIFFTSKMFDKFFLTSGKLSYSCARMGSEGLLMSNESEEKNVLGTTIVLSIDVDAKHTSKEVFDQYTDDEYRFSRTVVAVRLLQYGKEQLISRSQAKRLVARFEKFAEVVLDFDGIQEIGRAFADEIFRVFRNAHPKIKITAINTTLEIDKIIQSMGG
jgi:anti-sigma regulatory factor (Ser/Thr protein kinase)